jgi:threonine/homoserine/homoserine lactone efflux protein
MTYVENLGLFAVLVFGIIAVPGMDMLFVVTNALTGGRKAGMAATAGVALGGVFHTLFGTLAVGLILHYLPFAFRLMLYAGCAYMAWIGFQLIRSSISVTNIQTVMARPLSTIFRQGFMTCILNPKAYLFVFSVYPQFLSPRYGSIWPQAAAMGLVTITAQAMVYGGLALAASSGSRLLQTNPRATMYVGRGAGLLLISAAALTLAS